MVPVKLSATSCLWVWKYCKFWSDNDWVLLRSLWRYWHNISSTQRTLCHTLSLYTILFADRCMMRESVNHSSLYTVRPVEEANLIIYYSLTNLLAYESCWIQRWPIQLSCGCGSIVVYRPYIILCTQEPNPTRLLFVDQYMRSIHYGDWVVVNISPLYPHIVANWRR